jgi:carboxyl-terminal processing protease
MRLRPSFIALAALPIVAAGFLARKAIRHNTGKDPDLFAEVFSLVRHNAVDSMGTDALYEKAARGLVHALGDPYAELYTRQEMADFTRENLGGAYGGLGMQIEDHDGHPTIARVFPHGPAESGGLRPGDEIVGIDTAHVVGWTLDKVSQTLLGMPGTNVSVAVRRPGVDAPVRATFVREIVHQPSVPFAVVLDGGIGYIPLRVFSETAGDEVHTAIEHVLAGGARSIILDVRDNGGGSLDQALLISSFFVPHGSELASVRERTGPPEVYTATHNPLTTTVPIIVMIDGGSASATEIVAGALQDHDRALILGTTSFGKGLVQSLYPLDGGYALKLTTGRWYTPSGRSIQKPRKLLPDGRLVEVLPDSMESDSVRRARPVFHSDHGRVVYGGGAITPDLVITGDTLDDAERAFIAAIAPSSQAAYLATYGVAQRFSAHVEPDFTVQPAWRDTLFAHYQAAKVPVDRARFDAARPLIDRMLADRIAELAFSDSAAFRRRIPDDRQLTRALDLARHAHSQADLFTLAGTGQHG